jgi:Epoxide hydrolase N terminus
MRNPFSILSGCLNQSGMVTEHYVTSAKVLGSSHGERTISLNAFLNSRQSKSKRNQQSSTARSPRLMSMVYLASMNSSELGEPVRLSSTTDYDCRKTEAKLNSYPQFVTNIDGVDIHFIHVRSKNPNAFPVIITHGWPGSIIEQLKIIGPYRPRRIWWKSRRLV